VLEVYRTKLENAFNIGRATVQIKSESFSQVVEMDRRTVDEGG